MSFIKKCWNYVGALMENQTYGPLSELGRRGKIGYIAGGESGQWLMGKCGPLAKFSAGFLRLIQGV